MDRSIARGKISGLSSNLKNFILYVYSLSGFSIGVCFLFSAILGEILIKIITETGTMYVVVIPILLASIVDFFIDRKFTNVEYVLQQKTSSLLLLLFFKVALNSIFLAPAYLIFKFVDPMAVFIAFGVTLLTFAAFALYVFISGNDLAFRKNQEAASTFGRIVFFLVISTFALFLLKFVVGFFSPQFANMIDNVYLIISLILALIFVIYNNALIRNMYDEFGHDGVSLSRLGIAGSSMVIGTFIFLFQIILRILLKIRRRD